MHKQLGSQDPTDQDTSHLGAEAARLESEGHQDAFTHGLRAILTIVNELIACPDEDSIYHRTVELCRERLSVERCAIFLPDGADFVGAYGTDNRGATTDERGARFHADERWQRWARAEGEAGNRWLIEDAQHEYWVGDAHITHGHGWVAFVPIRTPDDLFIGIMVTDTAISGGDPDEGQLDLLAVLCTTLAGIVQRKRDEQRRLEIEAELQQMQHHESLIRLAGGVAHDFNNILTGLQGKLDLAASAVAGNVRASGLIGDAQASATRAAALSLQMLAYAGRTEMVLRPCDLSKAIGDFADLLGAALPKKAHLDLQLATGLPKVDLDLSGIQQVVIGLVQNAAESLASEAGTVTVCTRITEVPEAVLAQAVPHAHGLRSGPLLVIQVSDTGAGIGAEAISCIFEPFYSTRFPGRGLGLAATLGIIKAHAGAIDIRSRLGEGTTVTVLLPLPDPNSVATATHAVPKSPGAATILVVDDEPDVREVALAALEADGHTVLLAEDGEEALRILRSDGPPISLVVLDRTMPKLSGEEVLSDLCRNGPIVPVILASGYAPDQRFTDHECSCLVGFLQKPYRLEALCDRVREALADRRDHGASSGGSHSP